MEELEFGLETIGGKRFEKLTMDFLRSEGYDIHESGELGSDGGWDAEVEVKDKEGIVHASTQKTWRQKLREDAESVRELEKERSKNYEIMVFVTNQHVTGKQELEIKSEIEEKYGWSLTLIHRTRLLGELRQNKQELAKRFLDVELDTESSHLEEIEDLREQLLDDIVARRHRAGNLVKEPIIVLHVIPAGTFSRQKIGSIDLISDPELLFERNNHRTETKGKYKITYGQGSSQESISSYSIIRNDGIYECVSTTSNRSSGFTEYDGGNYLQGGITRNIIGLDPSVVLTVQEALSAISDMGFSGNAFISLSFIDAADVELNNRAERPQTLFDLDYKLEQDFYTTELYTVEIEGNESIKDIEPLLSEVWREFGYEETPNINDGNWERGSIKINNETLIEEGDR